MNNDNLLKLHRNMQADGWDVPDYDTFKKDMAQTDENGENYNLQKL